MTRYRIVVDLDVDDECNADELWRSLQEAVQDLPDVIQSYVRSVKDYVPEDKVVPPTGRSPGWRD